MQPNGVMPSDTLEKQAAFLDALAECNSITHAARTAGASRMQPYRWMEKDPIFAQSVKDAQEAATQKLEQALYERALKHDTIGAIFLLKAKRPHVYRDEAKPTQQSDTTYNIVIVDKRSLNVTGQSPAIESQAEGAAQEPPTIETTAEPV